LDLIFLQFGFLGNLVKVFPSLAKRPLHLTGESYAGTYIVCVIFYLQGTLTETHLGAALTSALYHENILRISQSTCETR
jgi:carboxypeptidase C (cathepsin A)